MRLFAFVITTLLLLFARLTLVQAQYANRKIDSLQRLLRIEKSDSVKAELLLDIGAEYRFRVLKFDSGLYYFQEALDLAREKKIYSMEMAAVNSVATEYNRTGRYAEALEMSLQNLRLQQQMHDTTHIFFTKREIMWVYRNIGDRQKELELARELHSFANSGLFKDRNKVAFYNLIIYNNLGNIYIELGQPDSALYYKHKMLTGAKQIGDLQTYVIAAHGLAETYTKAGRPDTALYYGRLCLTNAPQAGRSDFVKHAQKRLAYAFQKQANTDSALFYSQLAFQGYQNVLDTSGMQEIALLISNLFKSRQQVDSAYAYLAYYTTLKDRASEDEEIQKVRTLLFNKTMEQKQREQEQKQARVQYAAKIKLYSVLASLAVLLLVVATLYRNNLQKQKANKKIAKAYEELKRTQQQLIQSEKMASLGELTAGIAHEIQNPLNFVNNFSEVNKELVDELQTELKSGNLDEAVAISNDIKDNEEKISYHGQRADAIVKGMLQHSRNRTFMMHNESRILNDLIFWLKKSNRSLHISV